MLNSFDNKKRTELMFSIAREIINAKENEKFGLGLGGSLMLMHLGIYKNTHEPKDINIIITDKNWRELGPIKMPENCIQRETPNSDDGPVFDCKRICGKRSHEIVVDFIPADYAKVGNVVGMTCCRLIDLLYANICYVLDETPRQREYEYEHFENKIKRMKAIKQITERNYITALDQIDIRRFRRADENE